MIFTHDDYTIAWICALPLEMAAAKAMLDRTHPSLHQPKTDDNSYTLGSIHGHNIVVACLPIGIYGKVSASAVVSQMRSTFQNIQLGLMVGIGGGVPSIVADIRLGDIVVSTPTGMYNGVIQYDHGKSGRNGKFQRTGSLNKLPLAFLTAISQMQSDSMIGRQLVDDVISDTLQKNEEMRNCYSRPIEDQLFQATYDHQDDHQDDSLGCSGCDFSKLVTRPPQTDNKPHIYYGLIATGDQVMKNATIRDAIARELGILCFEMEAAGLMLPSLVVRGICDYCDSHKHKDWQGYALAAAAYAMVLLLFVPVTCQKKDVHLSEQDQSAMQHCCVTDMSTEIESLQQQKDILEYRSFNDWSDSGKNLLWVRGDAGKGKTMLLIGVVNELTAHLQRHFDEYCLSYFFCRGTENRLNTATAVLRGLMWMILRQKKSLIHHLTKLFTDLGPVLFEGHKAF
ncbi:Pfs NACHT and Ankyrin domain protein [Penicillium malachiteum]|uniref:Pfs NACHT and Ankyrin domain protein n=1 Tax=Penicillium malachiteum TaxID=1324776 RepID=UPI002548B5F7|nr:Pfs NACHT and Ankyrin domain protein [Penicillium malachiteum]KAJ5728976.1 Pfs NACHT and Ankyrin domain protein [Penicillium malachiteum]